METIKAIEDIPLISIDLKILKFLSFLITQTWRRYAATVPYGVVTVSEVLELYFSDESISTLMRNVYIIVLFINTIMRGVLLCSKRHKFEKFLEVLRVLYIELNEFKDLQIRQMLQEYTETGRKLTKANLIIGTVVCVGFVTFPLFVPTRALAFSVYFPGFDENQSPWYELLFLCQVIMLPMGMCTFVPFANLMACLMLFAVLMCKVLQHKLRNLDDLNNKNISREITWCIEYQIKLVSYVETFNDLTSNMFLAEYLLFGAMLCVMLYLIIIVKTIGEIVIILCYVIMIFSQSFILYYFANELYFQSLEVAEAAYDSNWYEFDVEIQKTLKLLILRSQKPCAILIGFTYPMNLERLQTLLKTTYSYYTLLQRLYG